MCDFLPAPKLTRPEWPCSMLVPFLFGQFLMNEVTAKKGSLVLQEKDPLSRSSVVSDIFYDSLASPKQLFDWEKLRCSKAVQRSDFSG